MFDQNQAAALEQVAANTVSPQVVKPDSPLATRLPAWDLLPAHTLLVRRRVALMEKTAMPAEAAPVMPAAVKPPVQQAAAQKSAALAVVFCTKCGTPCDTGDVFCIKCGARME